MNKVQVDKPLITRLINHHCIVIPTVYDKQNNRPTGMTVASMMPNSKQQLVIVFGPESHTGKLIEEHHLFSINVLKQSDSKYFFDPLGIASGSNTNKFENLPFHFESLGDNFDQIDIVESIATIHLKYVKTEIIKSESSETKLIFADIISGFVQEKYFQNGCYNFTDIEPSERPCLHYGGLGFVPTQPI